MKTTTESKFYGKSQNIEAGGCFAINFFRPLTSTNPVSVNGIPLEAGQNLSIRQNVGDIDTTFYEVVFSSGGGNNELYVTRILPIGNQ